MKQTQTPNTMNNAPTTYGEMYEQGNQFYVYYADKKQLVQIIETRTTKTGRVSAKFENCATGKAWWEPAKMPGTECKECPIGEGFVTKYWVFEGKR